MFFLSRPSNILFPGTADTARGSRIFQTCIAILSLYLYNAVVQKSLGRISVKRFNKNGQYLRKILCATDFPPKPRIFSVGWFHWFDFLKNQFSSHVCVSFSVFFWFPSQCVDFAIDHLGYWVFRPQRSRGRKGQHNYFPPTKIRLIPPGRCRGGVWEFVRGSCLTEFDTPEVVRGSIPDRGCQFPIFLGSGRIVSKCLQASFGGRSSVQDWAYKSGVDFKSPQR